METMPCYPAGGCAAILDDLSLIRFSENGMGNVGKEGTAMDAILYVIVPCYNEEACIDHCAQRLLEKLDDLAGKGLCSPQKQAAVCQRWLIRYHAG